MSHTTEVKTDLKFKKSIENILQRSCKKLGLTLMPWGKHRLFSSTEEGFAVKLPGWHFPVVLNENGIKKDDYNGRWGEIEKLNNLLRRVTAETAIADARKKGYCVTETELEGRIKLTLSGGDLDD